MSIFSKLLSKKNSAEDPRETCGKRAGFLGIALNILLAAGKITFGSIAGALSVVADGLNNLTDCGSNIVSVIGFKMSGKPADREHPFGHRRAETIAALVISVVILAVAAELALQSVEKLFAPEPVAFSVGLLVVLGVSVLVKLFMFVMNRSLARDYSAETFKATATDSLSDAIATSAVFLSLLISHYSGFDLDGYMGIAVAVFIAFSGASILKDTVSSLIGKAADEQIIKDIEQRIGSFAGVQGIHDLLIHDYGADKFYATVHVEVDSHMPIMAAHDLADDIERDFSTHTNIILTVHIDPLVYGDPRVDLYRGKAQQAVESVDITLRMHDFRVVGGETHSNLVFDVAVPFDCKLSDSEISRRIREKLVSENENVDAIITVERQNIE